MNFAHPYILLGLIVLVLLYILLMACERRRTTILRSFIAPPLTGVLTPGYNELRNYLSLTLELAGITLLLIALAGPRWGAKMIKVQRKGIDVIFVVDCSLSMAARDLKPNRMEVAKRELSDLIEELNGNRLGVIGFAGKAYVFCPLTLDAEAARMFIDLLDTTSIPIPGTAIGDAIRYATKMLKGNDSSRIIILLTDGEDHHSDPLQAARQAQKEGITIYTIGIGTPQGSKVPSLEGTGPLRTSTGQVVISKLDAKTLREIARLTGGIYCEISGQNNPLTPIYTALKKTKRKNLESSLQLQFEERFQFFIGAALILLLASRLFIVRLGRNKA